MNLLLIIPAVLVSLIPSILIYFWFRNQKKGDEGYRKACGGAMKSGLLSIIPVVLVSMVLNILQNLLLRGRVPALVLAAFYKFIVLAFAEELVKYLTGNKYVKQRMGSLTWIEVIAFMTIVACGFNITESITYAIGSDVITILVRGLTALHEFYGLIMGYYIGKSMLTGNRKYLIPAFGIPWFLHGLYDYSLTSELLAVSDFFYLLPFIAIILTWIIGITLFVKVWKNRHNAEYAKIIGSSAEEAD